MHHPFSLHRDRQQHRVAPSSRIELGGEADRFIDQIFEPMAVQPPSLRREHLRRLGRHEESLVIADRAFEESSEACGIRAKTREAGGTRGTPEEIGAAFACHDSSHLTNALL